MELMCQLGTDTRIIRAGNANMFLSPVFRETLSSLTGATIELYDTDGAAGAARGAGVGAGLYSSPAEAGQYLKRKIGRASCRERVCISVELGGRRIMKTKKYMQATHEQYNRY